MYKQRCYFKTPSTAEIELMNGQKINFEIQNRYCRHILDGFYLNLASCKIIFNSCKQRQFNYSRDKATGQTMILSDTFNSQF